ncbi:MAG: hypothetical protein H6832_01410 [Planctomycetes bacterium]|nr:hypothetical protein [Planctomycetota bacterium]MCB9917043.1 hypothetical protein [Planctomycetota bacterium]
MNSRLPISGTLAAALTASLLLGHNNGVISGKNSVPLGVTTGYPSCGSCHNATASSAVHVDISSAASVAPGANVPMKLSVADNTTYTRGGFEMETSAGTFVASANTWTDKTVRGVEAITHNDSLSRAWSFSWTAPTTPGLVTMTAVGNAADGDDKEKGDNWGWYGPDATLPGVPYRIFVNEASIVSAGDGCTGADGFKPVLGIAKAPAVNGTWNTEAYNLPVGTPTIAILGLSNTFFGALPLPLPLKGIGGGDCVLRVSLDVMQVAIAAGRGAGGGSALTTWLVPNDSTLRGLKLHFQQMTVDSKANTFGFSFSNALSATIQ